MRLGDSQAAVGIWNVASGRRSSIGHLADLVERVASVSLGRVQRPTRPGDVSFGGLRREPPGIRLVAIVEMRRGLVELIVDDQPAVQ